MAGGIWTTQNKRRPGAYINTKGTSQPTPDTSLGRTLLIGSGDLNWGPKGIVEVDSTTDFRAVLGTDLTDTRLIPLRETLKGALTVLYLNGNDGERAAVADEKLPWTFTAKYPGTVGNTLTVTVEKDPDDETLITVKTLFGTTLVDEQVVRTTTASGLESNAYVDVTFTGDATDPVGDAEATDGGADFTFEAGKAKLEALAASTSYTLAGGTTTSVDVTEMLNDVLATENYNVVTTAGYAADSNLHALVATAIERLRDDEGYKVRAVVPLMEGAPKYDHEAVSVVSNGVELVDGTILTATQAAGWFAGASASADAGKSLTYVAYPDAVSAVPKRTNEQTIAALNAGEIVFTTLTDGSVVVEQDINSLVTISKDKLKAFQKNRVIRTLDAIATDTMDVFHTQFIGKVNNDSTGRSLFKANRVSYLKDLSDASVINPVDVADLTVEPGEDRDSILVTLAITPIDAMEKLYMTITVN
ncbi:phage tail sheath C-terminal domain-containing protein [Levilactobacillus namurensis]|uniref:Phage tail sheath C-terminal domain-containing protein n=1 Tax=Levilactobacillus namurensis TaxID=380393 RepID=A0AAW8W9C1_9LACO|nr:phage tail sheath C-terminal domain-containing protein [Levilactobacillus namurensis]MDT7015322.1 phage tail sheath C-terminal domain-containing protein [Levilactobacillus namurensis]